jgi:hypothetical protein
MIRAKESLDFFQEPLRGVQHQEMRGVVCQPDIHTVQSRVFVLYPGQHGIPVEPHHLPDGP